MKSKTKVKKHTEGQGQSSGQTSTPVLSTGENSSIGERIAQARGSRNQEEYADLLGVTKVTLGRYERNERAPDVEFMNAASSRGDINPNWLLYGVGPRSFMEGAGGEPAKVWEQATVGPSAVRNSGAKYDATESFALIPLYDVRAAAGHGALAADRPPAEHWAFSRSWIAGSLGVSPSRLILVTVAGNSMAPDVHDGDVVMVDRGDVEVLREGVYVFYLEGHIYVKRLQLLDDKLSIISSNGDFPQREVSAAQENSTFRLIGRVIGKPAFQRF